MIKMEQRITMSRVNPNIFGAKHPVQCGCCCSEVRPAMTIERGYTVEGVSLVEAIDDPAMTEKPMAMIKIFEVDGSIEVADDDADAPVTMNMLSKTEGNAVATNKGGTATPMNIAAQEAEVPSDNVETETEFFGIDYLETENGTGSVETENAQFLSFSSEKPVNVLDEEVDQESCKDDNSDEDFETSDADKVQKICLVPQRVCMKIRLAIDKARLCLAKINCVTTKNLKDLSQEQNKHVEAMKKLTTDSLTNQEVVKELCLVSQELIKNMEYLKRQMLDCQQSGLVDIIATLKQDIETELSSMETIDDQVKEKPSDEIEKSKSAGSVITFLKDAPWTSFGFLSLLVANLGYFSKPWLFQSFQACSVRCLDYLRNSAIFQ